MVNVRMFALASAVAAYCVPSALAHESTEAFSTGFHLGVTAEQAEVEISSTGYSIGDIEKETTFGILAGGRLNTGSGFVFTAEAAFKVPQGEYKRPLEVYCKPVDCGGDELSFASEQGLKWSADATLGVGYMVTHNVLVSVGAGAELAEVFRKEHNFENGVLSYEYENSGYALGILAFVRGEIDLGGGWVSRLEYAYHHLANEKWKNSIPGNNYSYESEQAFKGSSIEIGVTKDF